MTDTSATTRRILLVRRPKGAPVAEDFRLDEAPLPELRPSEVLVRTIWLSLDPYMRGRMNDAPSYVAPAQLGEPMQGECVGQVEASRAEGLSPGDFVRGHGGWQSRFVHSADKLTRLDPAEAPLSTSLGVLGMPGLTAYAGILRIGELKPTDVVFVSGAAGAVGSTVVQIAKIKGCKVIGSAGGADKCAFVKSLGADHVIDYKQAKGFDGLVAALKTASPTGIDVYFDNVGGDHLTAAIEAARPFARFALCGMIAQYNETGKPEGPHNIIMAVGKQLKLQGFIVSTHVDMQPAFLADMAQWIPSGQMKFEETVMEGIEKAPEAFLGLFSGANTGKMLVKLG